jgi:SET domain-containing protein
LIPCTKAITDIQAGEEIFLHYGYDPRNCPSWYGPTLDKFLDDNPDLEQMEAADPERLVGYRI